MKRIRNADGFVCLDIIVAFFVILVVIFQLVSKIVYILIDYFFNKRVGFNRSKLERKGIKKYVL